MKRTTSQIVQDVETKLAGKIIHPDSCRCAICWEAFQAAWVATV